MTVEASFIMLFTLGVIVAILYCGFYFHDRCLLAGNGYEAAVWGAWQQRMGADTDGGSVAAFAQNRGLKKNWFYKTVDYEADVSRTSVTVRARAQNALPAIPVLQKLLTGGNWKDAAGADCVCIKKEAMIRRSRVLKELLEDGHD